MSSAFAINAVIWADMPRLKAIITALIQKTAEFQPSNTSSEKALFIALWVWLLGIPVTL